SDAPFLLSFLFTASATTQLYTLSLHDALPIFGGEGFAGTQGCVGAGCCHHRPCHADELSDRDAANQGPPGYRRASASQTDGAGIDRKSTRLNSSHVKISYAVFCLKKKKKKQQQ